MTEKTRFQTLVASIRPHRVAVLTKLDDPDWQDSCLGILEFFTKLWGGSRSVIIPTDGRTISDDFWAILSAYDPDIVLTYRRTFADLRRSAPDKFERIVSEEVARHPDPAEEIREQIEDALARSFSDNFVISAELKGEILVRLAPFHLEKNVALEGKRTLPVPTITRGSAPPYPLTRVLDVLDAAKKPERVVEITRDAPEGAAPPELWIAAATGRLDSRYLSDLSSKGIASRPILTSASTEPQMISWGTEPWKSFSAEFPLALCWTALNSVRPRRAMPYALPTIALVGDTIREFCAYHALFWLQGRALWLPRWFMPEKGARPTRLIVAAQAAAESGRSEHNEELSLVTYSADPSLMQELSSILNGRLYGTSASCEEIGPALLSRNLRYPSRLVTEGNLGDISTQMVVDGRLPGWFDSPIPRSLHPANPQSHRWIVDLVLLDHLVPRHPSLGKYVVSDPNLNDARAGKDSVSYMCPGVAVFGNEVETNLLRPSIRIPDAEEIFRLVMEDCGYNSKTSDKGRYEAETVRKFGGLENAGHALRSPALRTLLMKFLDQSGSVKGVHDEGVRLKDGRRYLNFASISKILEDDSLAREIIDHYVEREIFYRGYVFLCGSCSDASWHSIAEVDQTFTCRRCGTKQQYRFANWKSPSEPAWFYKLDEMIYLALENNGHVPLLTLDGLRASSGQSFLFRPEVRITPTGSTKMYLEVDICCVTDGRLCVGEAKSNASLAGGNLTSLQTVERYRDLALKMGASVLVFSTTEQAWDQPSADAIRAALGDHPQIEVKELTSADLYS